ncbi:protein of unknown function [Reichenbachiella agariperforans]|uniref:DUF4249 domain-containing protein n=1 Tax=Reichenbachiella agariperforans TaxID=156994 RepID=A0A1M6RZU6_REIAG|nr:DUF4249 domain-containing protein [Reichenbachiella agariperforans]SHK37996.1 protein of unknown function [Reichenbachiella agariperforans]
MKKHILIPVLLCLFFSSCIERLGTFKGKAGVLVVSGNINNQPGPYTVNLSPTKVFGEGFNYQLVEGAIVRILSDDGEEISLTDRYRGKYTTPEDFVGEVGKSYQLMITLRSGESYESDWTEMKPAIPINTVYYTLEERPILTDADVVVDQSTLVFWLEYNNVKDQRDYFRWSYVEDFKVMSPLAIVVGPETLEDFPGYGIGDAPYKFCYARTFGFEFLKVADDLLTDGQSQKIELTYFPFNRKLDLEYSIEIYQHTVSEKEYNYWDALQTQYNNVGSIFETSNYQIQGNLKSIDDPDELVLGYFGVSAASTKRVFLVKGEIPYEHYYACGGEIPPSWCFDCRSYSTNATIEKPSFWP